MGAFARSSGSTLRRYTFGRRLAIVQVDARSAMSIFFAEEFTEATTQHVGGPKDSASQISTKKDPMCGVLRRVSLLTVEA